MEYKTIKFSRHAIQQMFFRGITNHNVKTVLDYGEVIKRYPEDVPYPSYLKLAFVSGRPIHIVFSVEPETRTAIIITAYIPEKHLWSDDFKKRRGDT